MEFSSQRHSKQTLVSDDVLDWENRVFSLFPDISGHFRTFDPFRRLRLGSLPAQVICLEMRLNIHSIIVHFTLPGYSRCRKGANASGAQWELKGLSAKHPVLETNQLLLCVADEKTYFGEWDVSERIQMCLPCGSPTTDEPGGALADPFIPDRRAAVVAITGERAVRACLPARLER